MKRIISFVLLSVLVLLFCSFTGAEMKETAQAVSASSVPVSSEEISEEHLPEAITQVALADSNYPEAVKILGEPDEEELNEESTIITYRNYSCYGISGELLLGFRHSPSDVNRSKDELDYFKFTLSDSEEAITKAEEAIKVDYDKLFGNRKDLSDEEDNEDIFSWKNELRVEISLFVSSERNNLELYYGNKKYDGITQVFLTNPDYSEAVKLLGRPDEKTVSEIIYQSYDYYGMSGELWLGFDSDAELTGLQFVTDKLDKELITKAADEITADYDKLFGNHKDISYEENDADFIFAWFNEFRVEIELVVMKPGNVFAVGCGSW